VYLYIYAFEETAAEGHDDESCRQAAAHRQQPGGFFSEGGHVDERVVCKGANPELVGSFATICCLSV